MELIRKIDSNKTNTKISLSSGIILFNIDNSKNETNETFIIGVDKKTILINNKILLSLAI